MLCLSGTLLEEDETENCVPLLVIRHKSVNRTHVILPSNWGMAFWVAFSYAGARAGTMVYSVFYMCSLVLSALCNVFH